MCAPNAFKGALGAAEAAAAMAAGVRDAGMAGVDAVEVPVADGGDGTLDVLLAASPGSRVERVHVSGPLGGQVEARLGWLAPSGDGRRTAVVEMAEAAGLRLVAPGGNDPLRASTHGVGELIRAALDRGARRIVVGVGGSATTDGGAGLVAALGARLLDADGVHLPLGGWVLTSLAQADLTHLDRRLRGCAIEVAVDVRSPLLGPSGAAAVFGPQKGASPQDVIVLDDGLRRFAQVVCAATGADPRRTDEAGMGAAGGCAFGLAVVCDAALLPGAALVCDLVHIDDALRGATLALTGEGRLDASTAAGKAPAEVAARAAVLGVPCVALAGSVERPIDGAYAEAVAIGDGLPLSDSLARTADLLRAATAAVVRRRLVSG